MSGVNDDADAGRLQHVHDGVGDLVGQSFLDLEAAGEHLHDPRQLRQSHDPPCRDVGHVRPAIEWKEMMLAEGVELDVTVTGPIRPDTGEVMDLGALRALVDAEVVGKLDHRNLNLEVEWFRELIPTAENIAVCIWRALRATLPAGLDLSVRLWETPRNYVDYHGE